MMTKRFLLALLIAAGLSGPALAQPSGAPATSAVAQPATANPRVALDTAEGRIVLELEATKAPITTANFLKYVDARRFDGIVFYRASKPPGATANDFGLIQGGIEGDLDKAFAPITHESTTTTGLKNVSGTITMARGAPGSARADWFIMLGDQPYLDADPNDPKAVGFAAFGHVVEGLEVVQTILGLPTDPDKGVGAMKGEMLKAPVKIKTARRVAP
jgi:peptidyl-prolyl cis-trans isomerase A (cyclophilin A)